MLRVSKGDREAFSAIFNLFWNKVYTQCLVYIKSPAQAEDLTQEVFLKLWANRTSMSQINNLSSYLFIITKNEILSSLRRKEQQPVELFEKWEEDLWRPDKQLQYKEIYDILTKGIDLLPPARQNVFKMSRFDGKSYDEIAAALTISRNGVKDHIVKALIFLRQHIQQQLGALITPCAFFLFK